MACASDARASSPPKARSPPVPLVAAHDRGAGSGGPRVGGGDLPAEPPPARSPWMTRVAERAIRAAPSRPRHPRGVRTPGHEAATPDALSLPDENAVQTPAPGLARPLRLLRLLHRPGSPPARWRPAPGPVRLRLAFQRLGGAWIKLGQMLALRFDLLPVAVLRRAVQAPQPGRAVLLRGGPARSSGRSSAPSRRGSSARSATSRSRRRPSARSTGPCCTTAIAWRSRSSARGSARRSTRTSS